MAGRLSKLRALVSSPPTERVTSRYQGPSWEYRRARVFERLGIDVVIDVGANAGQYALELREHGYLKRIVSFEPAAAPFARLLESSESDPLWAARQLALGSDPGIATLHIAGNEGKSSSFLSQREMHFGTTEAARFVDDEHVHVSTLEAVTEELISAGERVYLKLDVQGFELAVLDGAEAFLPRVLAVETELALFPLYHDHPDWRELCDRLERHGFAFYAVDPGYSDWESGRLVEMDGMFVRRDLAELH